VEALYYMGSLAGGPEFETDMRWFVEVSRVGENGVADEYCVEAKQWQAALQEARKLRGDLGALSKFSIELLDRGYRAVDPSLKLRYLINEAPPDAPLTGSGESSKKNGNKADASGKHRIGESLAPSAYATSLAATPFTTSLAPPGTATSSPVPRPSSHAPPRPASVAPPRAASVEPPRAASPVEDRAARQIVVPDDPVPPAPPLPSGLGLPAQSPAAPPPPRVPQFELVRQRAEEPRPDSPITYREFAYAVEPGRTRDEVEALLRDRYQATLATIEDRPPGKFVQLAVFDHVFKRRPERPPLATFAWKDWRGEPVLAFPGFGEEAMGPVSRVPPARESVPPPNESAAGAARTAPSLAALPLPSTLAPASSPPAAAPLSSVPPPSAPLKPMAPVVISSVPPPKAVVAPAAPASVEVEIPITEAAPVPAAEVLSADAAPASVEVEIPITEAAPSAPEIPIVEAAPSALEIPIVEAAPSAPEIPIVEAAPSPVEVPISVVEGARTPAVEVPISIVEGTRAPVIEAAAPPAAALEIAAPSAAPPAVAVETAAPSAPAPVAEAPVSLVEGTRAPVVEAPLSIMEGGRAPVVEAPRNIEGTRAPNLELTFEPLPSPAAPPANPGSTERASRPRIAVEGRRRAGEDLIGELFEIMHELHFARDVAEGAQFVLSVLDELLPCEGVLIHVFDINTGHFVVVRAKGPSASSVLLQRMSDQDPLVRSVMRTTHAISVRNATDDVRFAGPRWQTLGVAPRAVLCGGVQLSGRYLGLIEIANPHGDIPFHQSELHALDYICEQFAAFLSKKPIVLSADVVLSQV